MNPANATTNSVRRAQSDTTSLHQTLSASAKAKNPASVPGNAALITDATKAVDLSTGKIAISEFSTAMIDAANLARARMSGNNAPDAAITASTNDHVASLASQILPSGPTNSTAASALGVPVPLNSPQWGTDFGRQFVSMLQNGTNGTQVAELRLDPPELGPLRITLNLSDNVAHAAFFSPHAAVRQTVENALPQLQELLAQAGISLGDTSVNDQSQTAQDFSESRNQGQASGQGRSTDSSLLVATSDSAPAARSRSPDALVDTFA
ncbi:MAG: flagellar hook-length control protein FliK [Burkholderiaceae bacterium]|nr:flagellar hook-length control protein FliK [Burkholderiaceae bacterium]